MSDSPSHPKRVRLSDNELDRMSQEQLIDKLKGLDSYVDFLEERQQLTESSDDSEELKDKLEMARRKENTLVVRLTNKEQEVQEYLNKIQELKLLQSSRYSSSGQLRSMQLDPAINLVLQRMQKEMDTLKEKLEQSQNELSAWKFTPDSQTGKKLMSKCRMLHQENEELGKVLSTGRIAKLERDIGLEKDLVQEMKKSQSDLDEFLGEIDEDVEGMQGMVYMLQQELKDTKVQLNSALERVQQLETSHMDASNTSVDSEMKADSRTLNDTQSSFQMSTRVQKIEENHLSKKTELYGDKKPDSNIRVKTEPVEPMEVDSSDQWTTRTTPENLSFVNSTHSPTTTCNSSSSNELTSHKRNVPTTEHQSNATANEVTPTGDSKSRLSDVKKGSKHDAMNSQNGIRRKATSLDALDE